MMKKLNKIVILIIFLVLSENICAQSFEENKKSEYISWTLLQLIPSPVLYNDQNINDLRMRFGLRWHITPLNISFFANEFVSPVQFFKINPVRRFTGSAEVYIQPELATGEFSFSNLKSFWVSIGSRVVLPVLERGENMAVSIGGKYSFTRSKENLDNSNYALEAGIYIIGGIVGIQYTYNFKSESKYNFGIYFKYF